MKQTHPVDRLYSISMLDLLRRKEDTLRGGLEQSSEPEIEYPSECRAEKHNKESESATP